ncbi:hypothetical protein ACWXVQ_01900 [Mycoplasma sp. 527]
MHEIELNYFQLNRKQKLDVITTYSNLTNKRLSLKAKCSISTIKRLKQKLRNAKLCKKEVNLAHGNQWGDRKKIYSNDLIINYEKIWKQKINCWNKKIVLVIHICLSVYFMKE